ncbi:hypothetical protein [Niabella beijingensis]|uniref:hypothetical protein n=1 Tax=Niabella beijingensis TaxID=2872700 RepID=UPI001CBCA32E|nr:hypothetical protein [Niabella beijingensis]MBZ4188264.1 hypothetical protein [Niabella beijingensis]
MKKLIFSLLLTIFSLINVATAQSIVYADVNKADVQRMNFEIIGKLANNYLIYKEVKGNHQINVFNESMQLLESVPITFLPKKGALLDLTFYPFHNYAYLLYQFQKDNVVYCNAARIEANGKVLEEPVTLDTTIIAYKADRKISNSVKSSDGNKILLFKINKKNPAQHVFKTRLYDGELNLLQESRYTVPMENKGDFLNGYSLTNNGDFAFVKYTRLNSGNIQEASLIVKPAKEDAYQEYPLSVNDLFLDDIKLKVDEENGRYLMSSFYSAQKRGNIAGVYNYALRLDSREKLFETTTPFNDELRKKVGGKRGGKTAFNDLFINSIIIHQNGGFSIGAEALYTSNAGGMWDRWNYWGGPYGGFYGPYGFYGGWGGWGPWGGGIWSPYYYYSPFFYRSYWWGAGFGYGGGYARYNAGNIGIFSFDKEGNRTTENIIFKNQSEIETDGTISYQVLLDGDRMHFILNRAGKISDLDDVVITEDGQMTEAEPIEAKDKYVDFMPRYGKQVGPTSMIIPYLYKKNISFAKVDF